MAHSDDKGLILPPKIAPVQVVIVPIYKGEDSKPAIDAKVEEIMHSLQKAGIRAKYDNSDNTRPGWKFAEYEMKGVPIRLALGMRDIENNVVEIARRDGGDKQTVSIDGLTDHIVKTLDEIQTGMFEKALKFRTENIREANSWEEFTKIIDNEGGFVAAHWDGTEETEDKIKELTKATIRCIPLNNKQEDGKCVLTGNPSSQRVYFAKAY